MKLAHSLIWGRNLKDLLNVIKYPLPFLIVGMLFEWWLENPCLKKIRQGRDDTLWHGILILLTGGLAWLIYLLASWLIPSIPSLIHTLFSKLEIRQISDELKVILQGFINGALSAVLLLPIHYLSTKICQIKSKPIPPGSDALGKESSDGSKSKPEGPSGPQVINIVNIYMDTARSGRVDLGPPSKDGSLKLEFGPVKPGNYVQVFATTLDQRGRSTDLPISDKIEIPEVKGQGEIYRIKGSEVGDKTGEYRIRLSTADPRSFDLFASPIAGEPDRFKFVLNAPPGTLQQAVQQNLPGTKGRKS